MSALWDGEVVVLSSFHERDFGLPCTSFVRGLLFFYGLDIQNLHPNLDIHIACFITLCEAYLGMELHWKLWSHLFNTQLSIGHDGQSHVGRFTIQLLGS
jgi:hypothetical protein